MAGSRSTTGHYRWQVSETNDRVRRTTEWDGRQSETDNRVTKLYIQASHHQNITVIYIVQNLFAKTKEQQTITLNSHCIVFFFLRTKETPNTSPISQANVSRSAKMRAGKLLKHDIKTSWLHVWVCACVLGFLYNLHLRTHMVWMFSFVIAFPL